MQRQEGMPPSGDSPAPLARAANSPEQPADKKSKETVKPAQSSDRAGAEPDGETDGRPLALAAKERKDDVAKQMTKFYIYFRLRSDTTPAAPAAKPDNR
jgi:hypothetical protein